MLTDMLDLILHQYDSTKIATHNAFQTIYGKNIN